MASTPPTRPVSADPSGAGRLERLPEVVQSAWADCFLGSFPVEVSDRLLEGATVLTFDQDESFTVRDGRDTRAMLLVADGLARATMAWTGERHATIRYVGAGDVMGLPSVVLTQDEFTARDRQESMSGHVMSGSSLSPLTILSIPARSIIAVAETDAQVALAAAREVARLMARTQEMLAANVFLSIRARVARHLLDLAKRDGERLVVDASHAFIAQSIGSVREVVSRTLKAMEREHLVSRNGNRITLLDPAALHRASR